MLSLRKYRRVGRGIRGGEGRYFSHSHLDWDPLLVWSHYLSLVHICSLLRRASDHVFHLKYCSGQINWDASKLLTEKNMYPELGRCMLTGKSFWDNLDNFSGFLNFFDRYCTGNRILAVLYIAGNRVGSKVKKSR